MEIEDCVNIVVFYGLPEVINKNYESDKVYTLFDPEEYKKVSVYIVLYSKGVIEIRNTVGDIILSTKCWHLDKDKFSGIIEMWINKPPVQRIVSVS